MVAPVIPISPPIAAVPPPGVGIQFSNEDNIQEFEGYAETPYLRAAGRAIVQFVSGGSSLRLPALDASSV